ncbi:MAG: SDR family NAD(P)-dependent oxidoreductase, partial [Candidatus Velamenicoccus archaeovorus]
MHGVDRVVLVTGGGGGIGRAAAARFLELGDTVVLSDVSRERLDDARA